MAYCGMIDTDLNRNASIAAESMIGSGARRDHLAAM